MSIILNIDTAVQSASLCLADGETILGTRINGTPKEHAAWLHVAIRDLVRECGLTPDRLDAISVSSGPGSYTGLRVGMATAKGLCYALERPLITINTLKMMAFAGIHEHTDLLCPMIDARRMEVFTAVYGKDLKEILKPSPLILQENSFRDLYEKERVLFFGNGSQKFRPFVDHPNALFKELEISAKHMLVLSYNKYREKDFADLAYSEPFYGKEFHSTL